MKFLASTLTALLLKPAVTFAQLEGHNHESHARYSILDKTECVPYLKIVEFLDGKSKTSWSCKFRSEDAKTFGGITMMDIEGVTKEELDAKGIKSGEYAFHLDSSAYVYHNPKDKSSPTILYVPKGSKLKVEEMDWKTDTRHTRNQKDRRERRRKLVGTTGNFETIVIRVTDSDNKSAEADESELEEIIFTDFNSVENQFKDCSYNKFNMYQTTEFSSTVNGIVGVNIDSVAAEVDEQTLEEEARIAAADLYGDGESTIDTFDLVIYCQPFGLGGYEKWWAYAYLNYHESFYQDRACTSIDTIMHEIGHNMGLHHAGEGDWEYGDETGHMGIGSYTVDRCFNAAKSYQLGWYPDQVKTMNTLDLSSSPQTFLLNGIADYNSNNVDSVESYVSLRLTHNGDDRSFYIGYNRKVGMNIDTHESTADLVTLTEQEGVGISWRLAALASGQSHELALKNPNLSITFMVNSIDGKYASVTISSDADETPTQAPSVPDRGCKSDVPFHVELLTDDNGTETGWGLWDEEGGDWALLTDDNYNYDSNTLYHFPSKNEDYCLAKGRCYQFVFEDTSNDGICCSFGKGYFKLTLDGEKIYTGGEFTETNLEIHRFCIGDDSNGTPAPTEYPTYFPTEYPTGQPTPANSCTDDPTFRLKNKKKKTCAWIGKKGKRARKRFCKKKIKKGSKERVWSKCPETCSSVGIGEC